MPGFENRREEFDTMPAPKETVSRRHFLRRAGLGLGALALTSLVGDRLGSGDEAGPRDREKRGVRETWETSFDTGNLAGADMPKKLFAHYFCLEDGKMPERLTVKFSDQLIKMWAEKDEKSLHNPEVKAAGEKLLDEYCSYEPTPSSIEQFTAEAGHVVETVVSNIDWNTVRTAKAMSKEDIALVQRLADAISGRDLTALCMTELMPSENGEINREAMDLLLQHAGKEFIESIPALLDRLVSFGPYQFTSHALDGTRPEPVGASIINSALPEQLHISQRVELLRGNAHHAAAVLYMIDNLCNLVIKLRYSRREVNPHSQLVEGIKRPQAHSLLASLTAAVEHKPGELALFLASAHHAPEAAFTTAKSWLETGGTDNQRSYRDACPARILAYVTRMDRHLGSIGSIKKSRHMRDFLNCKL